MLSFCANLISGKHDYLQQQEEKAKADGRTKDAESIRDRINELPPQPLDKKRKLDTGDVVSETTDRVPEQPKSKKPKKDGGREQSAITKSSKKDKLGSINGTPAVKQVVVEEGSASEASDEGDTADHTAALLQGFESSSDEEGSETGDLDEDGVAEIPSIPADTKLLKKLKSASNDEEEPGVIYVG